MEKTTLAELLARAMDAYSDKEILTMRGGAWEAGTLHRAFVQDYGGGPDFPWGLLAWTRTRVYQVREYDGWLYVGSVPRNPEDFGHDDGEDDNG